MAFRMMRYSIAAMHRHLEADHDKLPLVVPILFYQGEATPYPLSMCWFDMFYSPELARRVYNSPFPLVVHEKWASSFPFMPKVMRHCKKFRDVHFDPDAFATTDAFI